MILTHVASAVDTVFLRAASRFQEPPPVPAAVQLAELDALLPRYDRPEWLADPDAFLGPPRPIEPVIRSLGTWHGAEEIDLRYPSPHVPLFDDVGERYQSFPYNNQAHARWFMGDGGPRPVVIAIHGYGGGTFRFEARVMPARRWLREGLDVVLVALPFHGPRRAPGDRLRFPSSHRGFTVEGFRQAIAELRALISWLLARGVPWVGVAGMSLGGYTASLLLTIDPRPRFGLAYIPLASFSDYAREKGRYVGTHPEQLAIQHRIDRIYAPVSPLHRAPLIPARQMLVVAGEGDRVTPISHAERLAAHFGCELVRLPGGHLLQVGRHRGFDQLTPRIARARRFA